MWVRIIVHNCRTQHRIVLIIFPSDNHRSSDAVYWRGGGPQMIWRSRQTFDIHVYRRRVGPSDYRGEKKGCYQQASK